MSTSTTTISLTEHLVREVRNQVLAGNFPSGKLPPERELCQQFKASRVTVRRALDLLEREGLIERQHGRGSFIKPFGTVSETRTPCEKLGTIIFIAWATSYPDNVEYGNTIGAVCQDSHYECIIWDAKAGEADLIAFVTYLDPSQVKAVIWAAYPTAHYLQAAEILRKKGIPLVGIDRELPGAHCDTIMPDNYGGAYAATNHLLRIWQAPVYFLGLKDSPLSAVARFSGYCQAMYDAGFDSIDSYVIPIEGFEWQISHDNIMKPWLGALPTIQKAFKTIKPAAVMCGDDYAAYAVYLAASEKGWQVGRDIGVTGYGDLPLGVLVSPKLTTVGSFMHRVAERAARLAIQRAEGFSAPPLAELIPTHVTIRESSQKTEAEPIASAVMG